LFLEHTEKAITNDAWQFSVFKESDIVNKVAWHVVSPGRHTAVRNVFENGLEVVWPDLVRQHWV